MKEPSKSGVNQTLNLAIHRFCEQLIRKIFSLCTKHINNYWLLTEGNCNINTANIDIMMKSEVVYSLNKHVPYLGAGWYYSGFEIQIHCKANDVMSPLKNWRPLLSFPVLPSCVCSSFLHCLGQWSLSCINPTAEKLRLENLSQHLWNFFWRLGFEKKTKQNTSKNT